jgi:hypothetical protein
MKTFMIGEKSRNFAAVQQPLSGFTMNERSLLPGERVHDPDREGLMVPSERSQANGVA